jgi:hypothetical protein
VDAQRGGQWWGYFQMRSPGPGSEMCPQRKEMVRDAAPAFADQRKRSSREDRALISLAISAKRQSFFVFHWSRWSF